MFRVLCFADMRIGRRGVCLQRGEVLLLGRDDAAYAVARGLAVIL